MNELLIKSIGNGKKIILFYGLIVCTDEKINCVLLNCVLLIV
jgi:hypothetical protein